MDDAAAEKLSPGKVLLDRRGPKVMMNLRWGSSADAQQSYISPTIFIRFHLCSTSRKARMMAM